MATVRRIGLSLVFGSLIFILLPLLGWGLGDVEGFADHGARLAYIVLIVLLHIVTPILFPEAGRRGEAGKNPLQRQRWAVFLMQIIPIAMLIAAPYCDRREIAVIGDSPRYLGLILIPIGLLLFSWAEVVLGKQSSLDVTIQEDHKLVTQGLYKVLRHPRYVAILFLNLGIALVFQSWLAVLLVVALVGILLWRIQDEETLLHQEFGTDWDAYTRKSWRLIPFIY
jgi:protein-S-isoprenylcysteine O-methyltransferase Ste14